MRDCRHSGVICASGWPFFIGAQATSLAGGAIEVLTNVRIELKGLSEKMQSVKQNQTQANQGISSLATGVVKAGREGR